MKLLSVIPLILLMTACFSDPGDAGSAIKVEVAKTEAGYRLLRGGEPYVIRGAGMDIDDIERFAEYGGNSIRTWTTSNDEQDTRALLDKAHSHDVTVGLGLSMTAERHGFDYDDPEAVARQQEAIRAEVLKYKDHPALLFWLVGNELNHSYSNPAVWDAVNDIASMIHELDPSHPVTTPISGFKPDVIAEIEVRAPAIDFISFQMYGSLFGLPEQIAATGFDEPFMMTEWGTIGYWEMESTAWGAATELTSSEKAGVILRAQRDILDKYEGQLIGSYVFKWGQKQERTPTWYSMFLEDGTETEVIDVMHSVWTGAPPNNRAPRIEALSLDSRTADQNVTLKAGGAYPAAVTAHDPDGDALDYRWVLMRESRATQEGGDREQVPDILNGLIADNGNGRVNVTAPGEAGAYRLFVYVHDGQGHAGHANLPFLVE